MIQANVAPSIPSSDGVSEIPPVKRSISSRDIRNLNEFDGAPFNKTKHAGSQMAWMDVDGSTLNRVKSRAKLSWN